MARAFDRLRTVAVAVWVRVVVQIAEPSVKVTPAPGEKPRPVGVKTR